MGFPHSILCCFSDVLFDYYMCYTIQKNQRVQVIVIG